MEHTIKDDMSVYICMQVSVIYTQIPYICSYSLYIHLIYTCKVDKCVHLEGVYIRNVCIYITRTNIHIHTHLLIFLFFLIYTRYIWNTPFRMTRVCICKGHI